jgi:hypothetical protein
MENSSEVPVRSGRRFDLNMLREPRNLAILAFIAGTVFGLVALGWWLFPVQWQDATAEQLRPDLRENYLRAAIDSYTLNPDDVAARQHIEALGDAADDALAAVMASPSNQSIDSIAHFQSLVGGEVAPVATSDPSGALPTWAPSTSTDTPAIGNRTLLLTMCAITGILGLALAVLYFVRRNQGNSDRPAALKARDFTREAEQTDYGTAGDAAPLSQWMTTYLIGDDLFDDSFSIDSPSGEFMGECGVGIAEMIGVGSPKRVSAFEIWLFDKNDIQTVTKVLMSSHIFRDDAARDRLSAKGEPVLASPGVETVLETETLQMVARVVDMQYGDGPLPEESFFERVTIELAVWSKV